MRILAVSVFEGVVYHCWPIDLSNPGRPQLEVEALLRPGDADAEAGPLLLTVADYIAMVGIEVARPCLEELAAAGRIVQRLGVDHITFPTWSRRPIEPAEAAGHDDHAVHPAAGGPEPGRRPTLGIIRGGADDRPDPAETDDDPNP